MVNPKPNVWFKADFPDDTVYDDDDDGDEVQFAGQGVARTIAKLLADRGYQMDEPENWGEKGWSLNAKQGRRRFWMLVTFIDDYVLQTSNRTSWLWSKPEYYASFLTELEAGLKADPRFSQLRWFLKDWPPRAAESFATPFDDRAAT